MAKKLIQLSAIDIILQADADTIREALESRVKIDDLLAQREEAYKQIEAIEQQVEELVGEEGAFVYPAPPLPIAGFNKLTPASRPAKPKPKPEPKPEAVEEAEEEPKESPDAPAEEPTAEEDK